MVKIFLHNFQLDVIRVHIYIYRYEGKYWNLCGDWNWWIVTYPPDEVIWPLNNRGLGPFSRKSRNFTGHFRASQFPLYFKNGEDLSRETSQLFFFLLP